MISNYDINDCINDVTFITTILLVSHFILAYINRNDIIDNDQTIFGFSLIIGYALHALIFQKISTALNNNLNLTNEALVNIIYDIVKVISIYTTSELAISIINNKSPNFDKKWYMEIGFTLLGFIIFDLFKSNIPVISKTYNSMYMDIIKISLGHICYRYLAYNDVTSSSNMLILLSILAGLIVYHLGTKRLLSNDSGDLSYFPLTEELKKIKKKLQNLFN